MPCRHSILPPYFPLLLVAMLSGCVGGPIAQQIASSVATQVADKVVGDAVDEQLRKEREPSNIVLMNTDPDPTTVQFATMQFRDQTPEQVVVEPLPPYVKHEYGDQKVPSSRLVPVEIWNLIIGEEKQAMLERSLQNGSTILPAPVEWRNWQLATGALEGHAGTQIYFLLPPDFGRVTSGDHAIVEIANVGGLHIARYRAN